MIGRILSHDKAVDSKLDHELAFKFPLPEQMEKET